MSHLKGKSLKFKPFYKLFQTSLLDRRGFEIVSTWSLKPFLMKTFRKYQNLSKHVVLKSCLKNEEGEENLQNFWNLEQIGFLKRVEINASFGNKIFWRSLVSKTKHTHPLCRMISNQVVLKTRFSFQNRTLLPFYLNQTKPVLKTIWNHFLFEKVKLSQSNLVFRNPFFQTTILKLDFWKQILVFQTFLEQF